MKNPDEMLKTRTRIASNAGFANYKGKTHWQYSQSGNISFVMDKKSLQELVNLIKKEISE